MYYHNKRLANIAASRLSNYNAYVDMIILDIPQQTIDDEIQSLDNALMDADGHMYAYVLGARRALQWLKDRKSSVSDEASAGIISLTLQ